MTKEFYRAILYDEALHVQELVQGHPHLLRSRGPDGDGPLATAIQARVSQTAAVLVECGAELDIFSACALGFVERVVGLLDDQPNRATARDDEGNTPLHWAAARDLIYCYHDERTVQLLELLISAGADIEALNSVGESPLHWAAALGSRTQAQVLFQHGATPDIFAAVVLLDAGEIETMLNERPLLLYASDRWQRHSPLHVALLHGRELPIITMLVERGGEDGLMACAIGGHFPLHYAARGGRPEPLELMFRHGGAGANCLNASAETPLFPAVRAGVPAVVKVLLEHGVAVNLRRLDNATALHFACSAEIANMLVDAGAMVDPRDKDGETPAHWAAIGGDTPVVRALLARGARRTIFLSAAAGEAERVANSLRRKPALAAARDEYGHTALHCAAMSDQAEAADALIRRGADVNAPDDDGSTPLHVAAWSNAHQVIRCLCGHGADLDAENQFGETPLDVAVFAASNDPTHGAAALLQKLAAERSS